MTPRVFSSWFGSTEGLGGRVSYANGFLFSVRGGLQVERLSEIQRGFAQRQPTPCRPEVEHVTMDAAAGFKTLKDVLVEIHRERTIPIARLAMHGASTATLRTAFRHPVQATRL